MNKYSVSTALLLFACQATSSAEVATKTIPMYVTGYSYWDNTPPQSLAIAKPVLHRQAGGGGTYLDPITVAVGHTIQKGQQALDFPAGTRFYFPRLQKYGIVEDVCGDGPRPQDGPCHIGYQGHPWVDVFIGGQHSTPEQVIACARRITAIQKVIVNPKPDLPVISGPVTEAGCFFR